MSDAEVLAAIERMEGWLQDPGSMPAAEGLADWNAAFQSAVAGAERGPGWAELVARAHALGSRVQERTEALTAVRDQIRNELGAQQLGDRALKGYGASAR
jgi:flagellar hook-associated protein FlgK